MVAKQGTFERFVEEINSLGVGQTFRMVDMHQITELKLGTIGAYCSMFTRTGHIEQIKKEAGTQHMVYRIISEVGSDETYTTIRRKAAARSQQLVDEGRAVRRRSPGPVERRREDQPALTPDDLTREDAKELGRKYANLNWLLNVYIPHLEQENASLYEQLRNIGSTLDGADAMVDKLRRCRPLMMRVLEEREVGDDIN